MVGAGGGGLVVEVAEELLLLVALASKVMRASHRWLTCGAELPTATNWWLTQLEGRVPTASWRCALRCQRAGVCQNIAEGCE
eukprot:7266417-Pyramimonas_sp.AAC.1